MQKFMIARLVIQRCSGGREKRKKNNTSKVAESFIIGRFENDESLGNESIQCLVIELFIVVFLTLQTISLQNLIIAVEMSKVLY